jgi:hypothetical protein
MNDARAQSSAATAASTAAVSGPATVDAGLLLLRSGFGLTLALAHGLPAFRGLLDDPSGYRTARVGSGSGERGNNGRRSSG